MVDIYYPLQWIADKLTYGVFRIVPETHLGASVDFIIYEVMKILILLIVMIVVISYMRTYITPEKTRQVLAGKKGLQYHFFCFLNRSFHPFLFVFGRSNLHRISGSWNSIRSNFLLPYCFSPCK